MVAVAMGGLGGSSSTSCHSDNLHNHAPWISLHPVRMVYLSGSKTLTVSLANSTLQSESQRGLIPTSEFSRSGNI